MALEGTHIKFALDVKSRFGEVAEIKKYISGSIYPDSRYATGIDRTLTHDSSFMEESFWQGSDFKKGWASHLICDKIQKKLFKEAFVDVLGDPAEEHTQGSGFWVTLTSLKALHDFWCVNQFDIREHLSALEYVENPNNEKLEKIRRFNQHFIKGYSKRPILLPEVADMYAFMDEKLAIEIGKRSSELSADPGLMAKLPALYARMIEESNDRNFSEMP